MPGGKSNFERLLDAATSSMLLEPNWVTNLELCDAIRQNDVTAKYALTGIRKRLKDSNPHVCKFALIVLETCVKNCGESFHDELASHEFMNEMRTLAQTGSAPVKEQILAMLQAWNHAFRNNTKYQPILATYNLMKMEGYNFPVLNESDAMFSSDTAPAWKEGDVCNLCRVKFGTFTRQHHCRACGEVFCNSCSSKKSIIPKIGIEREVRVCDPCFEEINPEASNPSSSSVKSEEDDNDLPAEYLNSSLAKEPQIKPTVDDREAQQQEEDELQLALALSLSQEEAEKSTKKNWSAPAPSSNLYSSISTAPPASSFNSSSSPYSSSIEVLSDNSKQQTSELDKYLDRSYWEKKNQEVSRAPSAPVVVDQQPPVAIPQQVAVQQPIVNGGNTYEYQASGQQEEVEEDEEGFASDAFVNTMEKSIDMFVQHMSKAQMKGKHIAMDTSVQSLFHSLSAMHPQLLQLIEDEEESKAKYEAMLNKLAVIREARETLNDMRAQHEEKMKQQELEQEMLRRMQMEQKLELMRQQKQEYLEYQRQLQIQRQMDLDNYQYEKLMQNQMATKVPQPGVATYMNGYSVGYPAAPHQQAAHNPYVAPPGTTQPDGLDADIVPPPPYSSLQGNKPAASNAPYSQPPVSYQDNVYQNVQLQNRQQQPLPASSQSQWNQQSAAYQPTAEQQAPSHKIPSQQGYIPPQQGQTPQQQGQVPPNQSYLPPQHTQAPPQQGQALPQQGYLPPQHGQAPPQPGQAPLSQLGHAPPQPSQAPLQHNQVLSQHGQLPPQHGQAPPQHGQVPPQQGHLPPQHGQIPIPPQHGQVPPQHGQVPPQHGQVPPQHSQVPPQQRQIPPQHGGVPPQGSVPHPSQSQQVLQQQGQQFAPQQPQPSHSQFQQPPVIPQAAIQQPQQQHQASSQQFQSPPNTQQQQMAPQQPYQDPNQQDAFYQQQQQPQQYYNQQPPYQQMPPSSQQQQTPQYENEMSSNMKDLQLISFD